MVKFLSWFKKKPPVVEKAPEPVSVQFSNPEELQVEVDKLLQQKVVAVVPRELPIYRITHPYGSISIYVPSNQPLSPERVLLLLEQAKHDLLTKRPISSG